MNNKIQYILIIFSIIAINGCSVFGIRTVESPEYEVISSVGDKEIRFYESYIIAKTTVQGEYKNAQNKAFKKLAAYIFGDNVRKQKISMTAPVSQAATQNEKIKMTAPVIQKQDGANSWTMSFMMPSKYKLEDLPKPTDKDIIFAVVPKRYLAVIQYTWFATKDKNNIKSKELLGWISSQSTYKAVSAPVFAGYDPPWTIPFLRRNEMMIEVLKN